MALAAKDLSGKAAQEGQSVAQEGCGAVEELVYGFNLEALRAVQG